MPLTFVGIGEVHKILKVKGQEKVRNFLKV